MQILLLIIANILIKVGLTFTSDQCLRPFSISLRNDIAQIESGHRNIVWSQKDQEQSSVTIPYNKANQRQDLINVIVSLVLLSDFDRPSQSIYLQLYPEILKFGQFNTIVKFNKNTRYRSLHIHFVISSSYNLRVGLKQLDSSQLAKINIDVTAKKAEPFRINVLDFNLFSVADKNRVVTNTTGYAFLSGFKSSYPNFELQITSQQNNVGPGILRISINATVTRKPIEILKISYFLVFQYEKQKETAYLRIQKYLSGVSQYSSIMNGTTGYKGSNIDYLKSDQRLRLLQQMVEYDPKKIFNEKDVRRFSLVFNTVEMALVDMAMQVPIAKQTLNNRVQLVFEIKNLIQKGKCIKRSTCEQYNGKIIKQQNQIKCQFCGKNQKFNQNCQRCQCLAGYTQYNSDSECKQNDQCLDGGIFYNGICQILIKMEESCANENKVFNKTTKSCDCPLNLKSHRTNIGTLCIPSCSECEIYNVVSKKCEPFCLLKMGKKVKCDSLYEINVQKQTCDCKDKTIRGINGNCVVCPYGTVANLEKQTCEEVDDETFRKARVRVKA